MDSPRVYCAGPLFNRSEREEMSAIALELVNAGFDVYLPHRDGMEFRLVLEELVARGWDRAAAGQFLHEAIFAIDVYQLAEACQAMVWNWNGRVPDEGAVSEAAMAWTLGKPLVAYSDDARSLIAGRVNPLLAGLVEFRHVDSIDKLPAALVAEIDRRAAPGAESTAAQSPRMRTACDRGRSLWRAIIAEDAQGCSGRIADCVIELFAPREPSPSPLPAPKGRLRLTRR